MCFRNFRISGKIVKQGELERNLSMAYHSLACRNFGEILESYEQNSQYGFRIRSGFARLIKNMRATFNLF